MNNVKHLVAGFILGAVLAVAPSCGGTKACSPSTCSTGCCDAKGDCQLGGSSNSACGQLGGMCQVCQFGTSCSFGNCISGNSFGGGTGNTGGGTGTGGGSTTSDGGACDGCINGSNGMCINKANSGNNTFCGQGGVACAACTGTQTCTNYVCTGTGTGGGGGTTNQPIGGACTSAANCQTGLTCKLTTTRGDAQMPGGYCSKPCTAAADCGTGNSCAGGAQSGLQFYGETVGFCVAGCLSAGDGSQSTCRGGYACYGPASSTGFCYLSTLPPFNGGGQATHTGQACIADTACQNPPSPLLGFCFEATLPDGGASGFTQGYCSADCGFDNTGTFCGAAATCVTLGTAPNTLDACLANCATPGGVSTCRSGYTCVAVQGVDGGAQGVCYKACTAPGVTCTTGTCNTTTGQCG